MLGDSLRALFIGNSYTQYNRLVRQVQGPCASTGHKLSVKLVEHGGWTLKKHAANPETLDAIREGNWDFVILQDQSKAPAREKEWDAGKCVQACPFPLTPAPPLQSERKNRLLHDLGARH